MRSDTWSAGIYKLETTNTSSSPNVQLSTYDGNVYETQTLGIRVWYGNATLETEITSIPVSEGTGSSTSELAGVNWNCPKTTLDVSHYVKVKVYSHDAYNSYWLVATFRTDALGQTQLDASTWNAYYHILRTYTKVGGLWFTKYFFYWGSSTYDSRITGFSASTPSGATTLNEYGSITQTATVSSLRAIITEKQGSIAQASAVNRIKKITINKESSITQAAAITSTITWLGMKTVINLFGSITQRAIVTSWNSLPKIHPRTWYLAGLFILMMVGVCMIVVIIKFKK